MCALQIKIKTFAPSINYQIIKTGGEIFSEDVSLNYVGDFVGDFAPRTYVSMREIVELTMVAAKLFVFIDNNYKIRITK